MPQQVLILLVSIFVMWFGAGVSILAIDRLSGRLKISSFLVSFFLLGLLTSISELSVTTFSVLDGFPTIAVGNLIGASSVIMLFIVPLFAIISGQVGIKRSKESINFTLAAIIIALPAFLVLDKSLSILDGVIIAFAFIIFLLTIRNSRSTLEILEDIIFQEKINFVLELLKILLGAALIVISSKFVVDSLIFVAQSFNIAPFIIGLLILSIGTNVPELTILIKSVVLKKKTIALGDYIGSSVINTLIFLYAIFLNSVVSDFDVISLNRGISFNLLLLPLGSFLLVYFSRNDKLERKEGIVMLILYILFIVTEVLQI